MQRRVSELRAHPLNERLYGSESLGKVFLHSVKEKGILVPLAIKQDGTIISGHRRWRAAMAVGLQTVPVEVVSYDNELDEREAVIEFNRQREKTFSQKMAEGEELESVERERARWRQAATQLAGRVKGGEPIFGGGKFATTEEKGKTRDKVAAAVGLGSGRTYDKAAKVWEAAKKGDEVAKKVVQELDEGKATVNEAYKTVVKQQEKAEREQAAQKAEHVAALPVRQKPKVEPGQWWQLGRHLLYCGDTGDPAFWQQIPSAAFAFADPPYNAGVAEWDKGFVWQHDWLTDVAEVAAVTPGIGGLFDFAKRTQMPYRWSAACWIDNGMTLGAMGFGNWIYVALFARGSVFRQAQDFAKVSISVAETADTTHKGRKPSALLAWLLGTFTKPQEIVVDPFLGSGTTLLVAEEMGRVCYGGELSPEFCADIIARWEKQTGRKAEVIPRACNRLRAS